MSPPTNPDDAETQGAGEDGSQLEELRRQIAYLEEALGAISSGGVDAVVVGKDEQEQIYTLTSADRPYRVIVESMGEGAATVSERGIILFANSQLARFLGVEADTMVGRDLADYAGTGQQSALTTLLASSSTETRRAEVVVTGADGAEVPFLVAATDIDLEGVLVRCLVLTDLTMQKLVEQQLASEVARTERQRVAAEVNDTIVQGLVAAEMALDLGKVDYARNLVASTSSHARAWIGELASDHDLEPGMAVRSTPAQRQGDV
jgi:PAS domain S-box-containing protein